MPDLFKKIKNVFKEKELDKIRKKQQKNHDNNKTINDYNKTTTAVTPPSSQTRNNNIDNNTTKANTNNNINIQKQNLNGATTSLIKPPTQYLITTTTTTTSSTSPNELDNNVYEDQMSEYKRLQRERHLQSVAQQQQSQQFVNKLSNNISSGNVASPQRKSPYSPITTTSTLLKTKGTNSKLRMNKNEYKKLYFSSKEGGIWVNDLPFKIKGINWFGCETETFVVHGLWNRDYKQILDFLKENKFNAIRIPFSYEMVVKDPFPTSITISHQMNKDFYGLRALSVLDMIIEAAGERGIFILFDFHSFGCNDRCKDGLWYNRNHSEGDVLKMWNILILKYGRVWNVLGIDIKNEPFDATWNSGDDRTDFSKAINRIGTFIQNNGGNQWLIFGQGIHSKRNDRISCWGESFENESTVGTRSTKLPLDDKFVYSPHCYGPSVVQHDLFSSRDFPHNLKMHWDLNFGTLPSITKRGMVIGEWGGKYIEHKDQLWMDTFVDYLISIGCTDSFYWCLNPNSNDTAGIYLDDWISVNNQKLHLLSKLCPNPTKIKFDKDTMLFKISSVV